LLREHGALLALRGGGLCFDDEPDPPPPAERLRENGQMLMLSSEPPLLPAASGAGFRPPASLRFSFSSAGFFEKMSVHRLDPPAAAAAAGGAGEVMAALGATGEAAAARSDASFRSGSGSGAGDTWPLLVLECDAAFLGRTGSGRRTPPAKSSSAQDGEAVGLASSGQKWNSTAEEALLLLLASDTSMAICCSV
jgi:hypothetical protein